MRTRRQPNDDADGGGVLWDERSPRLGAQAPDARCLGFRRNLSQSR
jgi:hypothetical protein